MINAHIATLPERIESFKASVESIVHQVDQLFVTLNHYENVPDFIKGNNKIKYKVSDNSRGSNEKIANLKDGWNFLCDDDIIYPSKYVNETIYKSRNLDGIFSYHGMILNERPISSYYRDRKKYYHFNKRKMFTTKVDIAGTGVMAFHTKTFTPNIHNYIYPNMTDIFTSIEAKRKNINLYVLKHKSNYFKSIIHKNNIWNSARNNDKIQTKLINDFF